MGEPSCCHPEGIRWHRHHGQLQEYEQSHHPWPAPHSPSRQNPRKLGTGRIFSLFDLVSSFNQKTVRTDTIPLAAFCTPTSLFELLVTPQGSSVAPGWLLKGNNEVTRGLDGVAAYLGHLIGFDAYPSLHV